MTIEFPEDNSIPEVETLNLLEYGGEQDLVNTAVAHAQVALPEWQPRESNTEIVLLESLALILGVEALALQVLPGQIVEQLMSLYGVTRHNGFNTEGQAQFQVASSAPLQVIPTGTRLRYTLEDTEETVDFLTVEAVEIITTETLFGTAQIEAEESGVEGNGIPAGATLELVDPLSFVDDVTVSVQTSGGESEEEDEDFQARAAAVLSRLNSTLVIPDNFTDVALSDPRVSRARTLDLFDPAGTPKSPVAGHVTIAILGDDGQPLSIELMESLRQDIESQALASLSIHVIPPTITTVNITCTVRLASGYLASTATTDIKAALADWLSPANWDWSPTVDQNAIIGKLYEIPAVRAVTAVNPTIALPGDAPLPKLGTVTVTFE
ncbi:baseplate J/gp47 family protein [Glutamicibacter ardleyensis]|uniref:baseplate J/gp47 family protein n=1 Tax=Glutamicibacter ardleyensis TaxID=225894 RepID=UPI003FD4F141